MRLLLWRGNGCSNIRLNASYAEPAYGGGVDSVLCCDGFAQDFRVGLRYDRAHVLFYVSTMRDSGGRNERALPGNDLVEYGGGGYLLPLSKEHLQKLTRLNGSAAGVPELGKTFTVLLGGDAKVRVTAEQYVEQWGMENPDVRVGILARIPRADEARFGQASASAFLIQTAPGGSLPATTNSRLCSTCEKKVLNRFSGVGELVLEKYELGWSVTLYRETLTGLRGTLVVYDYRD